MGGGKEQWIGVQTSRLDGEVPVWFVEYADFFARPGIYNSGTTEFADNAFRFALLSKAAMQLCKDRAFLPDVFHVHDWPSALVPAFLKTWDRVGSPLSQTASVLTIHNIGYQGVFPADVWPYIGIGAEHWTADKFEDHGRVNLLKAGIAFSDALTTVSPTHAKELLTPEGAHGLAPYIMARRDDLTGILNGCDYDHWNPAVDRLIPATFSPGNMAGKVVCKSALREKFMLDQLTAWPVFGIVSRFAQQKGFYLLTEALPRALDHMNFQLAVLGTGEKQIEEFFRWLTVAYRGRVGCHIGFSEELSHLVEAGSDFFLMPSLYEPCGLNQMYSMKYGSLPIVRATGGLEDTVENYNERTGAGTGFKFQAVSSGALHDTIGWAVSTWYDRPKHIQQLRQQATAQDFSWEKSAAQYVRVYEKAMANRRRV
jgi:starch synthase